MQIALFIAGAWMAAQPAEPLADRYRIAAFIKQLDDDDFRSRNRAARQLRRIGYSAIDLLAAAKGSVEVRERAERLAREIRFDSYPAGKPAEGMQATLRADREVFRSDQPITMQLEIKNVGGTNLGIPSTIRWSYSQTHGPDNHRVRGLYVPSHAAIEVHQLSGRKPPRNQSPIACGHPGNPPLTAVMPGNAIDFSVPVTMVDRLTRGEYEISVTLYTYHVVKDIKESLPMANPILSDGPQVANRVTVSEPTLVTNKVRFVVE